MIRDFMDGFCIIADPVSYWKQKKRKRVATPAQVQHKVWNEVGHFMKKALSDYEQQKTFSEFTPKKQGFISSGS